MKTSAVFLDRDGTIIEDGGYVKDPDRVRLLPGAAEAVRRLRRVADLVVLTSNQSGVARGLIDEGDLTRVHERMEQLLDEQGAGLDGAYYCPYLDGPEARVEKYRRSSDLRKPNPGMLIQASREMSIDLHQSWMIGNSASDVEAGMRAGCRTVWIGESDQRKSLPIEPTYTAGNLLEAVELIELETSQNGTGVPGDLVGARREILESLERIRRTLLDNQRLQHQQDFSLMRLFGALLQMFAIVAALWGLTALFSDQPTVATPRLILGVFLQVAALTVLALDRLR